MGDLRSPEKKFRPELEGVRAVAAFLVAIYHIWLGSVSGGVDVFFIVSGYLITTSLLSRIQREGRLHILDYLMGIMRRLFPLAFTVILTTAVLSLLLLPQAQWEQTISEIYASAFYFQNWELAFSAVDYLAQNNQASPYQHFWALSLQGQFYVTWPLVILLAYFIATKLFKTPVRKTLLGVLITLFLASLSYSVYITAVNQPWAYFDTFARVWEFSLGGMLALLISYVSFPKTASIILGWLGLAIIAFTGMLLPVSTVFPGIAALLPTGGVILVIIAAENGSRFGVERLLGSKPFMFFGSISYGFYLWHWPLLIFYFAFFGVESASLLGGIAIIAAAFGLSVLTSHFIETPVRKLSVKQSKVKLTAIFTSLLLPILIVSTSWGSYVADMQEVEEENYEVEENPGARAVSENIKPDPEAEMIPTTLQAKEDLPEFYGDNCYSGLENSDVTICSYGETDTPAFTLALVGGSHSGHWFPALMELTEELNMQIDVYNKDGCRFSDEDFDGQLTESCMEWNEKVIDPLTENPPDVVFTTANVNDGKTVPEGYMSQWEKLEESTEVLALRDTPRMEEDIPICVDENPDNLEECAIPTDDFLSDIPPWENTDGIPDNVTFADLTEYFCDDEYCRPVIGNVLVYRDYNHITTMYSRTLAFALKEPILEAVKHSKE
ncbi:acyltransferase family protein [Alteribacillus iranensis]|nr:acyltransferase family protein [Alteribacillus iranensis]